MLDSLSGFEWDVHNIGHMAPHGVTPVEVEQTTAGRYLVVVFTIRHNKMRTITAYTMNQAERRIHAPQIDA